MKRESLFIVLFLPFAASCKTFSGKLSAYTDKMACMELERSFLIKGMKPLPLPDGFTDFQDESFDQYCRQTLLHADHAGNTNKTGKETPWRLAHGSRLKIAVYDQSRFHVPYVKTIEYKKTGECGLGMRVYLQNPAAINTHNNKPFLIIHGGAWKYRNLTATAPIETLVPYLTSKGYVVFSPVYRLIGKSSLPRECSGALGADLQEDMLDVLAWIDSRRKHFNIGSNEKLAVAGQSAGAHLATYLLTERPLQIREAVLFYPPTDFSYFIVETKKGSYPYLQKNTLLSDYVDGKNTAIPQMDPTDKVVVRNSFPAAISESPEKFPPVSIIHGDADSFVPVENARRLCNAYNKMNKEILLETLPGGKRFRCGRGSYLEVGGGRHMLDLRCLSPHFKSVFPPSLAKPLLCAAGSKANSNLVAKEVERIFANF